MITKLEAIRSLDPNAHCTLADDVVTWMTTPISEADIATEQARLQVEYDAQDYARKREVEYPSTKDFMEAYTEKEIGGDSTKWDAYVINYNKVRTENPK